MKSKPKILQPRHRGAIPDPALDSAIAAHQRRLNARLGMIAGNPHARAALARRFINRTNSHRGFRS